MILIALSVTSLSSPVLANCLPPYQTQFACQIPERNARAEFCRLSDPAKHPKLKEGYYSYAVGAGPAELHFETNSIWFSTKDTDVDDPLGLTMAVGFALRSHVYAFVVIEDRADPDRIRAADVRVYSSIDAFTNDTKGTEIARLACEPSTIIADTASIRP